MLLLCTDTLLGAREGGAEQEGFTCGGGAVTPAALCSVAGGLARKRQRQRLFAQKVDSNPGLSARGVHIL